MAQTEKDYLSMGRKTRIDLALSLDIHRSNAMSQFWKFIFEIRKHGDPNKQMFNEQMTVGTFELNKDTNPFLRKYLNRKLMDEKWIANHIASLTYIMLWDILSETQPTIKDLYSLESIELADAFKIEPRETRRILNKYYDYMHYHPVKWSPRMEKLADNPNNIVWSFQGPRRTRPLPSKKKSLKSIGTPLTINKALNPEIILEDFADPYYLERLFAYRQMVLKMIETIKQQTTTRKEFDWLIDELVHSDYALTVLFQNAAREVEKRWFESLSPDSKFEVIFFCREVFAESEIARSISDYKKLCDVDKKVFCPFRLSVKKLASNALEQITLSAVQFANRGQIDVSKWIFSNLLASGFKIEGKDKAEIKHNLGIFEMLNKEYAAASEHFQSSLEFWASERFCLLEEIDKWNLTLALERAGLSSVWKQKGLLFDSLGKKQSSTELRLFLIRQFADISELFGDKSASTDWLERGLKDSAGMEDFFDIALYFEARLGSFNILGSNDEQRNSSLIKAGVIKEKCCTTLGDTENFIVVIEKKFYLLREDLMHSEG